MSSKVTRIKREDYSDPEIIRGQLAEFLKEKKDASLDEVPLRMHIDDEPRNFHIYAQVHGVPNLGWAMFDANLTMVGCDKVTAEFSSKTIPIVGKYPTVDELMAARPKATTELIRQWHHTKIHGNTHGRYRRGGSQFVSYMMEIPSPLPLLQASLEHLCIHNKVAFDEETVEQMVNNVWTGQGADVGMESGLDISRTFMHVWNIAPAISALYDSGLLCIDTVRTKIEGAPRL
jgi:hypothetical protein